VGSDWVGKFDYLSEYCKVVYIERTKNVSSTMLRNENFKIQGIGIIGTGRIAGRMFSETLSVSGVNVEGVYNPHLDSARKFADKYNIDAFDTLEEMYRRTDIIYVASPHETHYGYVKDALLHGKHVLCEKPFVLEKKQAEELFDIAKERKLILFEGIKTAFCPGFTKLVDVACSGLIGCIKYVDACFTKLEKPNNRELKDTRYGGSFLELGSYCLLPVLKLLGTDYDEVSFDSVHNEKNIDIFTKASLKFPKGLATVTCGLGVKSEGRLLIAGTKGYITVEAPWWKTTYFEAHFEDENEVDKFSEHFLGYGLRYEVSDLLNQINGNEKSEFKLTRGESIAMAGIMEKFMEQDRKDEDMGAQGVQPMLPRKYTACL
jgi:predicted dehydrogenase